MITFGDSTKRIDFKNKEPIHTVVGQNLKGESKLVLLKDRPVETPGLSIERNWTRTIQAKEEELWKESHPGKKLFVTVCNLCNARHLLDFDVEDKPFECTCEMGPPNKEHPKYYVCNAQHPHFDIKKSFNKTQRDCKICQKVINAQTKEEALLQKQVRLKESEDRIAGEKLRKQIEDGKAEAKAKEKKTEAELFAAVLTKQLTPLFEGLKQELRNVKEK